MISNPPPPSAFWVSGLFVRWAGCIIRNAFCLFDTHQAPPLHCWGKSVPWLAQWLSRRVFQSIITARSELWWKRTLRDTSNCYRSVFFVQHPLVPPTPCLSSRDILLMTVCDTLCATKQIQANCDMFYFIRSLRNSVMMKWSIMTRVWSMRLKV